MLKGAHATDWLTYFVLADVALIALLRHYFPNRFLAFIKVPLNATYFTEFAQEKEQPFWFGLILEIVMLISISLFIYSIIYFGADKSIHPSDYVLFIKIFLISVLIVTLQRFFHSVTGLLFDMRKTLNMWMHVKDAYLRWAAILLALVVILVVFTEINARYALIFGLISLFSLYIIGVFRGSVLLAGSKTLSGIHIFFYLCTLEILPIIVLVKMIA